MIESPTKPVAASPGDRPTFIGHVHEVDFYLQAHEAKNRGYHARAVILLKLAAAIFDVEWVSTGFADLDWETNLAAVDNAWAEYWEFPNA